jgi:formylglycine-generating enzyme required for sulfatase activity
MRYELKHDKLAAQVFQRASVLAKNRRRASEVYKLYAEEGHKLNEDDLDRLAEFLPVLEPPDSIKAAIQVAKDEIAKKQKEKIDAANKRAGIFLVLGILAVGFAIYAFYQNRKAQEALREVVRRDLKEVEELVLRLDYEGSWQKLQETAAFGVLWDSVSCQMAEPAFFYAEGGQIDRAKGMLDTIAGYMDNKAMLQLLSRWGETDSTVRLSLLRQSVIALDDSVTYKRLQARYYPEMVFVEGGRFMMDDDDMMDDEEDDSEVIEYEARVLDFWLSKYEATVWQYNLFCTAKGHDISRRKSRDGVTFEAVDEVPYQPFAGWVGDNPVAYVSWYDAVAYANWLSEQFGRIPYYDDWSFSTNGLIAGSHVGFRLPTNVEWVYAAKGGLSRDTFAYSGSNDLDTVGWYNINSSSNAQGVGQKKANGAGIYDMSGNVMEWCEDWLVQVMEPDLNCYKSASKRVVRGGSWFNDKWGCRVSNRFGVAPVCREPNLGFRLALVP